MSHQQLNQIILKPLITEKALADRDNNRYHFWVSLKANKNQIRSVFKTLFSVPALDVKTSIVKGKVKTDWKKRMPLQKPNRKKAVITVASDQKIKILSIKN
jgi:large subunit ribosomal protein L23